MKVLFQMLEVLSFEKIVQRRNVSAYSTFISCIHMDFRNMLVILLKSIRPGEDPRGGVVLWVRTPPPNMLWFST